VFDADAVLIPALRRHLARGGVPWEGYRLYCDTVGSYLNYARAFGGSAARKRQGLSPACDLSAIFCVHLTHEEGSIK
jgi:hypothetical protein